MDHPRVFPKLDAALNASPISREACEKFVIFSPSMKRYLRFDGRDFKSCIDFYLGYKTREYDAKSKIPDFQEVIPGCQWHRIMFDLDFDVPDIGAPARSTPGESATKYPYGSLKWFREVIKELIFAAIDVYYDMFDDVITKSDFVVCESIDPREPQRLSAHVTIARSVPNYRVSAYMTDLVIAAMPEDMRDVIDRSLNSSCHNLRMAGCAKPGSVRVKLARAGVKFIDTLVQVPSVRIPGAKSEQWICITDQSAQRKGNPSKLPRVPSDRMVQRACAFINDKYGPDVHRFRRQSGSSLAFDRICPSHCALCKRTHDHDNTVVVQIANQFGDVQFREICRHNVASFRRENKTDSPQYILIGTVTNSDGIDEAMTSLRDHMQSTSSQESIRPTEPRDVPMVRKNSEWGPRIPVDKYSEPDMRDYPSDPRTLFVRAPMKLGKTKALRRFVTNHASEEGSRVVFVSFRRTFSAAVAQKFPEFSMYTDINGTLDDNKMIVQVESLHRIVPDKLGQVDMLILDESESIIDQFDSGLSTDRCGDFAVFQWLVRTSRRCVALDAYMGERTYAVIGRIRGIEDAVVIMNEYKNAVGEQYYFASNREQWLLALIECVRCKEKVVICANSATEGRTLNGLLRRHLGLDDKNADKCGRAPRIKFYCAETPAKTKIRDFGDVDSSWTECEILIYTPTLTAGVSFEREHFDRLFGYFTDKSCSAQVCIQMMGRIRNIAKHQSFICLHTEPGTLPETREDMILCMRLRKHALMSNELPDIEFNDAGLPVIPDTDFAEIRVQNAIARNRSRNNFTGELIKMIMETGAKCSRLNPHTHHTIFGQTTSQEDIQRMHTEHNDVRHEVSTARAQLIASARELTGEEYKSATDLMNAQRDSDSITDSERAAVQKFDLRATYHKHDANMSPEFVMSFMDSHVMFAFRNLSSLCEYVARNNHDVARALMEMRKSEATHLMDRAVIPQSSDPSCSSSTVVFGETEREFDFTYVYEMHRLAHIVVTILGFASIFDDHVYAVCDIERHVDEAMPRIAKIWTAIKNQFKLPPIKNGAMDTHIFLDIAKTILEDTYCISVTRTGDLYNLAMSNLFRILPNGKVVTID